MEAESCEDIQDGSRSSPRPDPTPRWHSTTPYNKLQDGQIRLLQICPRDEKESCPLNCKLTVHELEHAPKFTALSYTWGKPYEDIDRLRTLPASATLCIDCNGNTGQVGENLFDFLAHYASHPSQYSDGHLWIDALAINQSDLQERSEQVKLMKRIYQRATRVFAWLGPADYHTESAITLMKGLLNLDGTDRLRLHPADVRDDHPNYLLNSSNWQALAQFFRREWFNRTWIIQEVVLANSVTLLCGDNTISWETLSAFSQIIATSRWTMLLKVLIGTGRTRAIPYGHTTPARLAAARRTWHSNHDDKFLYALIRARSSKSENPRDKVYSQLGLGDAEITPDYESSVEDVYITAARYILERSSSLFLLTCVEGEDFQTTPGLPSWVPDWSFSKTLGLRVTGYPDFNAALDLKKRQEIWLDSEGKTILSVEAAQLDEVVEIVEAKPELRKNLHRSKLWEILSRSDATYAPTGHHRDEAIWRALMTNRGGGTPSEPVKPSYPALQEDFGPSFQAWVLWRYAKVSEPPTCFPPSPSILPNKSEILVAREKWLADPSYQQDLARRASLYDTNYSHAMLQRPFFTRQGYVGIGTQCLQKDDSVWIVPGCRVPLIFRKIDRSDRYRLVGGAYVHGFMNGEALARKDMEFLMVELE